MFINYTNHNSSGWGEKQKAEAEKYGEIVNFDFPNVSPELTEEELYQLANAECKKILALLDEKQARENSAVLCQGECALNFLIVKFLLSEKIKVVTAVTERNVEEVTHGEVVEKRSKFVFQKFRFYDNRMRQSEKQPEKQPEEQPGIYPSVTRKNKEKDQDVILITAMGANRYQTTVYGDENGKKIATTGYAFDAVVGKENPNKLLLIGTEESKWSFLVKWYSKKKELSEKERAEGEALGELLGDEKTERRNKVDAWNKAETYICKHANFDEVKRVLIPNGSNEKEQKEYFNALFPVFKEMIKQGKETKIILDISNGFRSIPLYMMMFIRYVGAISNEKITYTIYYGMYEARDKNTNITPLVELSTVSELTDWVNAISEFRNMGSVKKLYQCLNMEREAQKTEANKNKIINLIGEFQHFDYALNSNNLYYLQKGIDFIVKLKVEEWPLSGQAQLMLSDLQKNFAERFNNNTERWHYSKILIGYAKLCIDQGRYGSAAISLQEGIITYIMERYLEKGIKKRKKLNDEEYKKYIQEYKNRNPVKIYFDKKRKKYEDKGYKKLSDRTKEFFVLYEKIKDSIRNVDAHIISSEEVPNPEEMTEWLNKSIMYMVDDMEQLNSTDRSLGFDVLYKDYFVDRIIRILEPEKNKKWILENIEKLQLKKEDKETLKEEGIDIRKMECLRQELLLFKKEFGNIEKIIENDFCKFPDIKRFICQWIESDNRNTNVDVNTDMIRSYMRDKNGKSGYERLSLVMQKDIIKEVIEYLKDNQSC